MKLGRRWGVPRCLQIADMVLPRKRVTVMNTHLGLDPLERLTQMNRIAHYVLTRITVVGGIYLAVVCLIPEYIIYRYSLPFALGGTSILIVVSVMMDTIAQIQSHLIAQQYEGLIKKSRLRGARR